MASILSACSFSKMELWKLVKCDQGKNCSKIRGILPILARRSLARSFPDFARTTGQERSGVVLGVRPVALMSYLVNMSSDVM